MGKVTAVCISEKKGTQKTNVQTGHFIVDFGIKGDAHAGNWHRQVSLISQDKVDAFNQKGMEKLGIDQPLVGPGAFGENLIVEGIDFRNLPIGTRLHAGGVTLRMTQIGKECHSHCAIYAQVGDCIMPREGVFAVVETGGYICVGDDMQVELAAV
ncbi:MAG: MOSC domain-containing protein [Lachnospiraceae bacterium]|nr:MOSC domain-containing protein [Lachnospiraceae bacterium]